MSDATENKTPPAADGGSPLGQRIACPQCKAVYRMSSEALGTSGRRVRCRHCGHVWRNDAAAVEHVASALGTAATTWSQLGSTITVRGDHASAMGRVVSEIAPAVEPLAADWVGKTLGRYQLRAVLGQGAMGYVYEAFDPDLKRTVALKLLPRRVDQHREPLGLKMFLQESRAAAGLQHPNIVTIYEVGQEDGTHYFAMERVHGTTLLRLIEERGPLPANQVCYIIAQAAAALAAGHAKGIIHRDVKPSNIMVTTLGHVKVTDFGLADVRGLEGIPELTGRALGTPGWISPEVARGEQATAASDVYGLGLTLFFAMTGKRLIQAESRSGMVRRQRVAKSIRREQTPESWPPRLRDIVVQCLQADPRDRYQSAQMLSADLLRALVPDETDGTVVLGDGRQSGSHVVPPVVSYIALGLMLLLVAALALLAHLWEW